MAVLRKFHRYLSSTPSRVTNSAKRIAGFWDVIVPVCIAALCFFNFGMGLVTTVIVTFMAIGALVYLKRLKVKQAFGMGADINLKSEVPLGFSLRLALALILIGLSVLLWIHLI